ncbi:MAG TPA: LLM class flavin-dependent oxidoreductase [Longimicrobium sp.]|nr:LLM class flavin-dependent oxidoreductase [Longimicrobium sp.]
MTLPLSVLDLAPIGSGSTASQALRNTLELARLADRLGYTRYWLAEHHGMPSIASSSPEILIGHVAAGTRRIRVGSGGIMLPNHVPLRVAENFHTLEALHPGRIDLGIGRAPGTDPRTSQALRPFPAEQFAEHLAEVIGLSRGDLPEEHPFRRVRVIPSDVELPPIWLLGSSGASARLAGSMGTGYSFARHFSPTPPAPAFQAYRDSFLPSPRFPKPHAILGAAVICAETDERAEYLASSSDLVWVRLQRGEFDSIPSPEEALAYPFTPREREIAAGYRSLMFVGGPETVRRQIEQVAAESGADEVMITSNIHSHAERMRSYELLAEAFGLSGREEPALAAD